MDTEMPPPPVPQMLDLTGLPEPLVRMVVEVVQAAREGRPSEVEIFPKFVPRPKRTTEEFRLALQRMGEMSTGQSLPLDFSSADIYDDHD